MVWTCELTGRPNLTYAEASESETKAKKCLANVPQVIRKPMLYIATLTRRGRYADMSEDVFNFVRDRYFVGEEVEAIVNKHWYDCKVLRPIYPTLEEIARYEEEMADSDEDNEESTKKKDEQMQVGEEEEKKRTGETENDEDIQIIKEVTPIKKAVQEEEEEEEEYPPFATFKYEVIEKEPWDYKQAKKHIVSWEQIRRIKGTFTREKCKLFLKQCVQLSSSGFWVIKERISKRYDLANVNYSDVFLGEPPRFRETRAKKIPASLNPDKEKKKLAAEMRRREKKETREKNPDGDGRKRGRSSLNDGEKERKKLSKEVKDG
ncbi:bromodomain adjacent to zinc finger domain protein 1A-like [Homarus americanus]|nr:bromodomain adjacent to zinc finger domain protein 1A-like [Homarus americanus]